MDATNAAVNAEGRIDMERSLLDACNGFGRTFHFAKSATDAGAENGMRHVESFSALRMKSA